MFLKILYESLQDNNMRGQRQEPRVIQSEIDAVAEAIAIGLCGSFILLVYSIVILIMLSL